MPRDAGDIERNVDDLGKELRDEMDKDGGEDKKVSVHSMVKAWNKMAEKGFVVSKQVTEGRVLSVKKKGAAGATEPSSPKKGDTAAAEGEDDLDLDDLG